MSLSVDGQLVTEVSGKHIDPTSSVKQLMKTWTLEDGTNRLSRNVNNYLQINAA